MSFSAALTPFTKIHFHDIPEKGSVDVRRYRFAPTLTLIATKIGKVVKGAGYTLKWHDGKDYVTITTKKDFNEAYRTMRHNSELDGFEFDVFVNPVSEDTDLTNELTQSASSAYTAKAPTGRSDDDASTSHDFVTCDGCRTTGFTGQRYKCLVCDDYDLCRECFDTGVHKRHAMVVLSAPSLASLMGDLYSEFRTSAKNCFASDGVAGEADKPNQHHRHVGASPTCHQINVELASGSSGADEGNSFVHNGIICDSCFTQNIQGDRFKCLVCNDYDLCFTCFSAGAHRQHTMLVLRKSRPSDRFVYIRQQSQAAVNETDAEHAPAPASSTSPNADASQEQVSTNVQTPETGGERHHQDSHSGWELVSNADTESQLGGEQLPAGQKGAFLEATTSGTAPPRTKIPTTTTTTEQPDEVYHSTEDLTSLSKTESSDTELDELATSTVILSSDLELDVNTPKFVNITNEPRRNTPPPPPPTMTSTTATAEAGDCQPTTSEPATQTPSAMSNIQWLVDEVSKEKFAIVDAPSLIEIFKPMVKNACDVVQSVGNAVSSKIGLEGIAGMATANITTVTTGGVTAATPASPVASGERSVSTAAAPAVRLVDLVQEDEMAASTGLNEQQSGKLATLKAMGFAQKYSDVRLRSILRDTNYDINAAVDVCLSELM